MYQDSSKIYADSHQPDETEKNDSLKYIAVRLHRISDADVAFSVKKSHKHKRKLVATRVEKRDPALRNFAEGLEKKGLQAIVDGCALYWLQIEDENSLEYYQNMNEVECVFSSEWFNNFKKGIRYFQGAQYVSECEKLAARFELKDQNRKINYVLF